MRTILLRTTACIVLAGASLALISGAQPDDAESYQVQYQRALLEFAELEHEIALAGNRRVAGAFSQRTIEQLEKNVMLSRTLLDVAIKQSGEDMSELHVIQAEELAKIADHDYRAALESQKLNPASVSKYQLEKSRIRAKIAKLRVKMWKEPKSISSLVDHMHWEIDRLSRDILDLHQRLERLE